MDDKKKVCGRIVLQLLSINIVDTNHFYLMYDGSSVVHLCRLPFRICCICRDMSQHNATGKWVVRIGHCVFITDMYPTNRHLDIVDNICVQFLQETWWLVTCSS